VSSEQTIELSQSRNAAPTAVILDETSEVGLLYGAKTTPHMYIIDKTRQLVYMGGIDNIPGKDEDDIAGAKNYLRAALDAMAAGKTIEANITRPYGCSVKYWFVNKLSRNDKVQPRCCHAYSSFPPKNVTLECFYRGRG